MLFGDSLDYDAHTDPDEGRAPYRACRGLGVTQSSIVCLYFFFIFFSSQFYPLGDWVGINILQPSQISNN